jgi:glycosyltransferase involved in cell wall biosynthesis
MQKRYKILVNCYACSPYHGSEPGMGWNFVSWLSKYHDLHIITEKVKWEAEIEKFFSENPDYAQNMQFHFIAKTRRRLLRTVYPPSYYWFYRDWQKKALALALKLDSKHNFDLIHQLNMVGFREPGYLWKIGKPFVWGPIGGMDISPWRMLPAMGFYGCLFYFSRNVINMLQMNFMQRPRLCAVRANALIAATYDNAIQIKKHWNKDAEIISEVGLYASTPPDFHSRTDVLKIAWAGLFAPRKALNLLIDALVEIKHKVEINVIGDGQCAKSWKRQAKRRGIDSMIVWHGQKSKQETCQIMRSCDAACITSLQDLTSTVLLEYLSFGLPVVALDHCGFSNVITGECGIKIPVHTPKQVVRDLAQAIDFVCEHEKARIAMAKAAYQRALEYNWENKILKINEIYDNILSNAVG